MTAALSLPALEEKQDWTVDDLASLPADLRYELIDGRLILPSPTLVHQELCIEISVALRTNCPKGMRPTVDLSLRIDSRNEPRPDVVVVKLAHANRSPVPVDDALLAVEVVSPMSHLRDMFSKTKSYAAAGIEHYWLVDPTFATGIVLTEYRLFDGSYEVVSNTNKVFETEVPFPATIDLVALTGMRDELLAQVES